MKHIDMVLQKIDNAYKAFKNEMLSLSQAELYDHAYKIFSVEEIYIILTNGYEFTEEMINRVLLFQGNILEQIYAEWIKTDYSHQEAFREVISKTLSILPERMCAYAA